MAAMTSHANTLLLEEPVYNYGHCRSNCVDILSDRNSKVMTNNITTKVPDVMLANVMSLVPKIDEVTEFIVRNKINLSLITETWLKESVPDSVIDMIFQVLLYCVGTDYNKSMEGYVLTVH